MSKSVLVQQPLASGQDPSLSMVRQYLSGQLALVTLRNGSRYLLETASGNVLGRVSQFGPNSHLFSSSEFNQFICSMELASGRQFYLVTPIGADEQSEAARQYHLDYPNSNLSMQDPLSGRFASFYAKQIQ